MKGPAQTERINGSAGIVKVVVVIFLGQWRFDIQRCVAIDQLDILQEQLNGVTVEYSLQSLSRYRTGSSRKDPNSHLGGTTNEERLVGDIDGSKRVVQRNRAATERNGGGIVKGRPGPLNGPSQISLLTDAGRRQTGPTPGGGELIVEIHKEIANLVE